MKLLLLASTLLLKIFFTEGNDFFIDDHKVPDEFFKSLAPLKTADERVGKLNDYLAKYIDNKTEAAKNMPFLYRKIMGAQKPTFRHDEIERDRKINWDPQHLKEIEELPFLKRVWARTKHPATCGKCNGLDEYKRKIDEKMIEKIKNITETEFKKRHGNNHEKCASHQDCESHNADDIEAAVVYEDVSPSEEKRREEGLLKEQQRREAIEKLNYHFYRRAVMESKLTGESPETIFKQYHKMNPEQLQQRFHAVYLKYMEVRKKMQEYYKAKQMKQQQEKEKAAPKDYLKSMEKKSAQYQRFLKDVEEKKRKQAEYEAAQAAAINAQKLKEEQLRREKQKMDEQKHKETYERYLQEQRKAKEQKEKDQEYKRQEIQSMDKQLQEIEVLKDNIRKEMERTKNEGDAKDLESLERLKDELLQWEHKVKTDKELKMQNLDVVSEKINMLRAQLLEELKRDVVHGYHRNEESFENAKRRYIHIKENFNKQLNKVRENLVKENNKDLEGDSEEDYDSEVYKDEDEKDLEDDYNTHERQLIEIDELKTHLTNELEKAKKEGKHVKDIYQLEGARKQIEDWEEKIKNDNVLHHQKSSIVDRKIGEFKGFLNSYKVYKYSTPVAPMKN